MTNIDLNKIDVLTDKTYTTETDSWTEYEGNFYESPFNNQAAYGQRYQSKNFDKSEYPNEGHTWYEKRPIVGPDMTQLSDEFNGNEIPYHHDFPRFSKKEKAGIEKFFTKPYAAPGEYVNDVYTTALPPSGVEVPDLIEHFTVGGVDIALSSIVLIIICIIIIITAIYYIHNKKRKNRIYSQNQSSSLNYNNNYNYSDNYNHGYTHFDYGNTANNYRNTPYNHGNTTSDYINNYTKSETVTVDAPMPPHQDSLKTQGGLIQTEQKYNQSSTFALSEDW